MVIFGIILLVLSAIGAYWVNKVHVYEEKALQMWHNIILGACALGALSAIVAGIVK
jgi:uncharacterized membrane protein